MRDENIAWLLREAGPAIRYRTWVELIGNAASPEARAAEALVLANTGFYLPVRADRRQHRSAGARGARRQRMTVP